MSDDGYVGVAADGDGKKVDTAELTRTDGTVVERQRVAIGDDRVPTSLARVTTERELLVDAAVFHEMLVEMRKTNLLLSLLVGQEV